jgi:hypothetical protein
MTGNFWGRSVLTFVASLWVGATFAAAPTLWVADVDGRLGTVDLASKQVTVIGDMGHVMTDIAFDPAGKLFGVGFLGLYRIDPQTAASTLVGDLGGSFNSLVFDAAGRLYTAGNALYSVNPSTGAASLIGKGGYGYASSGDLAFVGGKLYLSSSASAKDSLVQLNAANGVGTRIGSIGYNYVYGLATDNNVDLYGMSDTRVLDINPATGAGTTLFDYRGHGLGMAYGTAFLTEAAAPVPEPQTYAMILSGLAMIAFVARRRSLPRIQPNSK